MIEHQVALQTLGGMVVLVCLGVCGLMVWSAYRRPRTRARAPSPETPLQAEFDEIGRLIEARLDRLTDRAIALILRARFEMASRMRSKEGLCVFRALLIEADSLLAPGPDAPAPIDPPCPPDIPAEAMTFRNYFECPARWRQALACRALCRHIGNEAARILGRRQARRLSGDLPDSLPRWDEFIDSGGLKDWLERAASQLGSRLGPEQTTVVLEQSARRVGRVYPLDYLPRVLQSFPRECLLEERSFATTGQILRRELEESSRHLHDTEQELRAAFGELKSEKEKQEAILNAAGEGIFVLDQQGVTIFANLAAAKMLGYSTEELVGRHQHSLIHSRRADGSPYPAQDCPILTTGQGDIGHQKTNDVFWRKDGTSFTVEWVANPLQEAGRQVGIVVAFSDVTRRKKSEDDLRLFRNLINRSNDAIYVIDPATARLLDVNEKSCSNLGYTREELLRMGVLDIESVIPDHFSWEAHVEELRKRESLVMEGRHRRKDGSVFPVEINVNHIELQQRSYLIAVARDITERKRVERIMMQSEKLSAVGQLAAGVAHEINNPLGVILGFAEGIVRRIDQRHPLHMPLTSIEREALRCKNLVRDLLDFSRQGSAKLENVDLNAVIESVVGIIGSQARLKQVKIVTEFRPVAPCLADRSKLQQVVVNLCGNALDAMPEGGQLTIRTSMKDDSTLLFEVEDTGMGIPKPIQNRIFEPFFTTKEPGKGTGLGLALVHESIRKHGGTIEVKSEVGQGTTFTIHLPAASPGGRM